MKIQQRILNFITRANWAIFIAVSLGGMIFASPGFTRGIIFGGLLVTINFHLLARTLRKAFVPPHIVSHRVVLAKYYVRFFISGVILFVLISQHWVEPLGLFVGLSVVVASIMLATMNEVTKLILKEAH